MKLYKIKKSNIDKKGLYASKDIRIGTRIIQYKGKLLLILKLSKILNLTMRGIFIYSILIQSIHLMEIFHGIPQGLLITHVNQIVKLTDQI